MNTPKRFIAGAICPRCAEMDRIRSWEHNGVRYQQCVSCDFFDQKAIEEDTPTELETRVNRPSPEPPKDELQTVKILDPRKS
ncbi:YheV family putative zinc ribbon protein [Halomonas halocynthiae]|uniref:YheV family putative zinc ribbon protein n=1 Tax=Halomonas halocynthiae TaxID=176290 RepID=UPI0004038B35|nr:YheV family putative zinc ribbon protein [Halomonas halocynthiae]